MKEKNFFWLIVLFNIIIGITIGFKKNETKEFQKQINLEPEIKISVVPEKNPKTPDVSVKIPN